MTRARCVLVTLLTAVCGAAVLAGVLTASSAPRLEEAADMSQFRAGNIISDHLFFDGNAMSAADVQTFLNSMNPRCVPGSDGSPCLKDYRVDTQTKPADARCAGTYVGAPQETAATVIAKVGQAFRVVKGSPCCRYDNWRIIGIEVDFNRTNPFPIQHNNNKIIVVFDDQ